MSRRPSVAILGATGHVGRVLTVALADRYDLTLYVRRPKEAIAFARAECAEAVVGVSPINQFGYPQCGVRSRAHDAVLNCVGFGNPAMLGDSEADVFALTEEFDGLTFRYLAAHSESRLISFSSGAAYGGTFEEPAGESSWAKYAANCLGPGALYGLTKLASEARHRSTPDYPIVDLRLFGLFSRHIDPSARYLMNSVVSAIVEGTTLVTSSEDIVRDYVDPSDLARLVTAIIGAEPMNEVFDVYSVEPVRKFALLDIFAQRYGLTFIVEPETVVRSATGSKLNYYSTNRRASVVGYTPRFTSIEALLRETDAVLRILEMRT